ncbi:hypothetical protein O181_028549 [Austropuccinia psidii MF-1]|uniref:Uncharacterized protein n=1 Tax=Austropuccinia psidii MF-1 TaxID=1389203 RepID=A0A9Q3CP51_9BASI|nr:hypothetical protein [Austropuccinia psidii MF-1]
MDRNGTWIWQKTMSFENDKYSVDKDPYELCLRQSKRLKAIDPQMNIQMRNHKLFTRNPEELEHEIKCRCNENCTLDDIINTLQDVRKRKNIGKYCPYERSSFKEKQPFRVEIKDKPKERVEEVTKKKNSCHNSGSTDHYANNCPKSKKKVYSIEQVPEEESPTEDFESDSMGDNQDPKEELLVEYQEETQLEIHGVQFKSGMPQHNAKKDLYKQTQDSQTFLVTQSKEMAYINGTATGMTVCIDNAQHPRIIDSGAQCSIVARECLDNHFPNWEKKLLPTNEKNFKGASDKMSSIGTIIKAIIIPHRKGNIRLNPDFVKKQANNHRHKQGREIFTLYIPGSLVDPLEELLNEFKEGQFTTNLTSKQNLSLLKVLRKNRPAFSIWEEFLGKIGGHDIELYLDVERPYPPMLRGTPYLASLKTRKGIEKHINELLDMDVIRELGQNEIVEIITPVIISWHDGKSRLWGDFRALNNYTKDDRYSIQRIAFVWTNWQKTNT